jgi:hypothetical protein
MLFHLNLLHPLLALAAAACVYFARREIVGRAMSPSRLAVLPLLALGMTFVFFLFFLSLHQPKWLFPAALGLGLAIGAARGITMALRYDHMFQLVRPSRHLVLLWVTLALAAAVVGEAGGAVVGGPLGALARLASSELAALCAGALAGRALAVAIRLSHAPHVALRR